MKKYIQTWTPIIFNNATYEDKKIVCNDCNPVTDHLGSCYSGIPAVLSVLLAVPFKVNGLTHDDSQGEGDDQTVVRCKRPSLDVNLVEVRRVSVCSVNATSIRGIRNFSSNFIKLINLPFPNKGRFYSTTTTTTTTGELKNLDSSNTSIITKLETMAYNRKKSLIYTLVLDYKRLFDFQDPGTCDLFISPDFTKLPSSRDGSKLNFAYMLETLFNHRKFKLNVSYKIIVKVKVGINDYYTLFKTDPLTIPVHQRLFRVEDPRDTKLLYELYISIWHRLRVLTQEYYISEALEQGNKSPEIVTIEFFNIEEFIPKVKPSPAITNRHVIKKEILSSTNREFIIFGGHHDNIIQPTNLTLGLVKGSYPKEVTLGTQSFNESLPKDFHNFNYNTFVKHFDNLSDWRFFIIPQGPTHPSFLLTIQTLTSCKGMYYLKKAFNIEGLLMGEVCDYYFNSYSEDQLKWISDKTNVLVRKRKDETIVFNDNNELILWGKNYNWPSINMKYGKTAVKDQHYLPYNEFGVLDIEVKNASSRTSARPYAIGYTDGHLNAQGERENKTFYIDKEEFSDNVEKASTMLIHRCFESLMTAKNNYRIIYAHNGGKYDFVYILYHLNQYNNYYPNDEPYTFSIITRDNSLLKLVVKRKVGKKIVTINLIDSMGMLSGSLASLSKAYKLEVTKSILPYNFIKDDTIFYIGPTPGRHYYPKDVTSLQYDLHVKPDWSTQEETIRYLKIDLDCLYKVLTTVNNQIHESFGLQMTQSLTVSGLALKYFMTVFYPKVKDANTIPLINRSQHYENIRKSYTGGRTEVFIPRANSLSSEEPIKFQIHDVNSLYPYASKHILPGRKSTFTQFTKPIPFRGQFIGFFRCIIDTQYSNVKYFGLLPKRSTTGSLTFPLGKWIEWYYTAELELAIKHGYRVILLEGYIHDKAENVFTDFIDSLNKVKMQPKNYHERQVAKLLMNSAIGRYGMNPFKAESKIMNTKDFAKLTTTHVINDNKSIGDDLHLVTYVPEVNKSICEEFGVNYTDTLNSASEISSLIATPKEHKEGFHSISTASAILSIARAIMAEVMIWVVEEKKGKIYYMDTDSLVTDIPLPAHLVDDREMGKFKKEHDILEGVFLAPKTYCIKVKELDSNGNHKVIVKMKGVSESNYDLNDFIKMYQDGMVKEATKVSSFRNISKGIVAISRNEDVTLNLDYTKRIKIYKDGQWIDTKPISINELDEQMEKVLQDSFFVA